MWTDCRARFGAKVQVRFLFGRFGAADAMYAPVVARFQTYGVALAGVARLYGGRDGVAGLARMERRGDEGAVDLAEDEVDWPTVLKEDVIT